MSALRITKQAEECARYGRVGGLVGKGLKSQGLPIVVVDQDRRRVELLRERGVPAIYGDATTPGVLEAAGVDKAQLIVIATPEGFQTRRIIELARALQPGIDTAVGWTTGPTGASPPPPPGVAGSPTTPYVEATPRSPS